MENVVPGPLDERELKEEDQERQRHEPYAVPARRTRTDTGAHLRTLRCGFAATSCHRPEGLYDASRRRMRVAGWHCARLRDQSAQLAPCRGPAFRSPAQRGLSPLNEASTVAPSHRRRGIRRRDTSHRGLAVPHATASNRPEPKGTRTLANACPFGGVDGRMDPWSVLGGERRSGCQQRVRQPRRTALPAVPRLDGADRRPFRHPQRRTVPP